MLVARDRSVKATFSKVIPSWKAEDIREALKGRIAPDAALCSDGHRYHKDVAEALRSEWKVAPPTGAKKLQIKAKGGKGKNGRTQVFHTKT